MHRLSGYRVEAIRQLAELSVLKVILITYKGNFQGLEFKRTS